MVNTIRKILGKKNYENLKKVLHCANDRMSGIGTMKIDCSEAIALPGRHIFNGYYDVTPFSKDGSQLVYHSVAKKAVPGKDKCEIGLYDFSTRRTRTLTTTAAWCWQQGARLRWHPTKDGVILFNAVQDGKYVTRVHRLSDGMEETLPYAFYDIDRQFTYGLSLNFNRLQRLRPGYGYSCFADTTCGQDYPADDAILFYDMKSEETRSLVTLAQVASLVPDRDEYEHYFNHISISPSGTRFIFFHLMAKKGAATWRTRLYVSDLMGEMTLLDDENMVSHYCWEDDMHLTVTYRKPDRTDECCRYDVSTGDKKVFSCTFINQDGHPVYINDHEMIIDTYPNSRRLQTLYLADTETLRKEVVTQVYHDPRMYGEKRCDLHPKLSHDRRFVAIDTTNFDHLRCVVVIEYREAIEERRKRLPGREYQIDELQLIQKNILMIVDEICRRNRLNYYLAYGTAIGALRHGAAIPWDYDMDLIISGDDLARFIEIMRRELPNHLYLDYYDITPNYSFFFPRVCVKGFESTFLHVDIFKYIGLPDDASEAERIKKRAYKLRKLFMLKNRRISKNLKSVIGVGLPKLLLLPVSRKCLIRESEKLVKRCPVSKARSVINPDASKDYRKVYDRNVFGGGQEIVFSGITTVLPSDADTFLRVQYGDYMEFPPAEQRHIREVYFVGKKV